MSHEYEYRIKGEPTAHDAPADFDRQYELLRQKLRDEHERSDKIEGKVATLIAGTIAIVGFSVDHVANGAQAVAVGLFAIPLWEFYNAYKTITWEDAPSPGDLLKHPWFPQTTVASAAVAIANCIELNRPRIDEKARAMNRGFSALLVVTAIVVLFRILPFVVNGDHQNEHPGQPAASSSPAASAPGADAAKSDNSGRKSGQKVDPSTSPTPLIHARTLPSLS